MEIKVQIKYLKKLEKMRKLEKAAFETKTKEIKILATIESTNFIHKWSIKIMSAVSKEFRTLLS